MKKYKFTGETKHFYGRELKRILRLADGWIGGWIESEKNLSHNGKCFVFDDAKVYGESRVFDDVQVYGNAQVLDNAHVYGNARVYDDAQVYGDTQVFDNAKVYGNARVYGDAKIYGDAIVTQKVITSNAHKHYITISDDYIQIGCENHPITHWKKEINTIAKKHGYTERELKALKKLLNALLLQRKIS